MKSIPFILLLILTKHLVAQQATDTMAHPHTTANILLEQLLSSEASQNNMVRIETVTFPPGYQSKKHRHPCPLFVYVLEGELLSEFEGVKKVYKTGSVFYEKENGLHSLTQNNSQTVPAKILIVYLMKKGMETFAPVQQ